MKYKTNIAGWPVQMYLFRKSQDNVIIKRFLCPDSKTLYQDKIINFYFLKNIFTVRTRLKNILKAIL